MEQYTIADGIRFIKTFLADAVKDAKENEMKGVTSSVPFYTELNQAFHSIVYEISQGDYSDSPEGDAEIAEQIAKS